VLAPDYGPSEVALAFRSLEQAQLALGAALARSSTLVSAMGGSAPDALFASAAQQLGGSVQPEALKAIFCGAHSLCQAEQLSGNAERQYVLQSVPSALLRHDSRLFTAHTYVLAVSKPDRDSAAELGAGGSDPAQAHGALRQLFMSDRAFLSLLPAAGNGQGSEMSDGPGDAPLVVPLVTRPSLAASAEALPMWDAWLPKLRAAAREALASHPALEGTRSPGDECTLYALLECVWLLDASGEPWLVDLRAAPNLFPFSNVDRHVKETLVKDVYGILIAPTVEEAAAEAGSFVAL